MSEELCYRCGTPVPEDHFTRDWFTEGSHPVCAECHYYFKYGIDADTRNKYLFLEIGLNVDENNILSWKALQEVYEMMTHDTSQGFVALYVVIDDGSGRDNARSHYKMIENPTWEPSEQL